MLKEESVFARFPSYSGSLLAGRSARRTHDRSEPYAQSNLFDTRVLFLNFAVYTTNMEIACPFAASGSSIRPCQYQEVHGMWVALRKLGLSELVKLFHQDVQAKISAWKRIWWRRSMV